MAMARGKEEWGEGEDGKGGINGGGKRLDFGGEHTVQYADDELWSCTPETCMV